MTTRRTSAADANWPLLLPSFSSSILVSVTRFQVPEIGRSLSYVGDLWGLRATIDDDRGGVYVPLFGAGGKLTRALVRRNGC